LADVIEVPCDETVDTNGRGTGTGDEKDVAASRTAATGEAYRNAVVAALEFIGPYGCPERCPQLVVTIELGKAKAKRVGDGQVGVWYTAKCDWTVTLSCSHRTVAPGDQTLASQDLHCDEQARGRGTATATGEDADADAAVSKALKALPAAVEATLESALVRNDDVGNARGPRVRCDGDCPGQRIRIRLDPPTTANQAPAEEGGNWKVTASRRYSILVDCHD
jgi:hypothetical protein